MKYLSKIWMVGLTGLFMVTCVKTGFPRTKQDEKISARESQCKERHKMICTMEYEPVTCEALGPQNEKLTSDGRNRCEGTGNLKLVACNRGIEETVVNNLKIKCVPGK